MKARVYGFLTVLSFFVCVTAAFGTQLPKMSDVKFENWGFKASIPLNSEKITLSANAGELSEIYLHDGLAYIIQIIKTPSNSLTSTAIEQKIQSDCKKTGAKRWEIETKSGNLFKGTKGLHQLDADALAKVPQLEAAIGGKLAFHTISMAPMGDESSPMLCVGVIGKKSRSADIENVAKYLAQTVVITDSKKQPIQATAQPKKPLQPIAVAALPKTLANVQNKIVTLPVPPKPINANQPNPRPALKKGEIQMEGVVASIWTNSKGLVLNVDSFTMPGKKLVKLSPPRPKTVIVESSIEWIKAGAKILVVGKNDGVGQPIYADIIEPVGNR